MMPNYDLPFFFFFFCLLFSYKLVHNFKSICLFIV